MADSHTPTTDEVRERFIASGANDVNYVSHLLGPEFDCWLAAHDAKVRAATLEEAEKAVLEAAPPLNAELSMPGGAGPVVDRGIEAYTEGFRDAYVAVKALTPVTEREEIDHG